MATTTAGSTPTDDGRRAGALVEGRGVFVGDGTGDVGAAWNAGLDGIHVERHGHDRRGQCVLADYRVRSFHEFPQVTADS
jgi:phosphoglycolate phosphatase-like HAD superfamily hydrolase